MTYLEIALLLSISNVTAHVWRLNALSDLTTYRKRPPTSKWKITPNVILSKYDAKELPDLVSCTQRQCPDPEDEVKKWLCRFLNLDQKQPTGRLLMTLNEGIADSFSYVRRTAWGTQTPAKTLRIRSGSCRDFALLMIEAARLMGFAARFVTGYIYVRDRDVPGWLGGGSTHAWCQIYLPGSGWVEFDPTNGIVGSCDLIRVAVARTPEQAIPLSGVYWGAKEDELDMEVQVNVKAEEAPDQVQATQPVGTRRDA